MKLLVLLKLFVLTRPCSSLLTLARPTLGVLSGRAARPPVCAAGPPDSSPQPTATDVLIEVANARASAIDGAAAINEPATGVGTWLKKWFSLDKEKLALLGVDAFFTYGFVSNVNAGLTIALAWGTFCRSTGASPLAAGQWAKFLPVYVGIYATLGTVLRPFRMALAVGLTPKFSAVVDETQRRLPFYKSRHKLNRTLAMVLISLLGNVGVTCLVTFLGVGLAGLVTGVPAVPPGWRLPGFA